MPSSTNPYRPYLDSSLPRTYTVHTVSARAGLLRGRGIFKAQQYAGHRLQLSHRLTFPDVTWAMLRCAALASPNLGSLTGSQATPQLLLRRSSLALALNPPTFSLSKATAGSIGLSHGSTAHSPFWCQTTAPNSLPVAPLPPTLVPQCLHLPLSCSFWDLLLQAGRQGNHHPHYPPTLPGMAAPQHITCIVWGTPKYGIYIPLMQIHTYVHSKLTIKWP